MSKITAIIQARTGSNRFPKKMLHKIDNETMIWHVINRIKNVKSIQQIVLVTTEREEDQKLLEIAKKSEINGFVGKEIDVLDRFFQCAKKFDADPIIRITGDCPLIDPFLIEKMIQFFVENKFDYISNRIEPTFPDGLDTEIFTFHAIEKAKLNARLKSDLEHVTPYITKNPELFKIFDFKNNKNLSEMRWCVDEKEDLEFVKKIYDELNPKIIFSMDEILNVIKKDPKLLKINAGKIRDQGYLDSLKNDNLDKTNSI
jgi:spore coat polysaccharide biosynthesis protein SpsF